MGIFDKITAVADKLKEVWNKPAFAPLTEPLKIIGKAAAYPIYQFIDSFQAAYENRYQSNKPFVKRLFSELNSLDRMGSSITVTLGAGVGAVASAIGAGVLVGMGGAGFLPIAAASVAALGVGFVATPLVVVGVLACAGATVGASGLEEAAGLVQAQVLHAHSDQVGGHRDAVDAAPGVQRRWLGHPDSFRWLPFTLPS